MTRRKDLKPVCRWSNPMNFYAFAIGHAVVPSWASGCGEVFESIIGPKRKGFTYCPYCGKPLIEKKERG